MVLISRSEVSLLKEVDMEAGYVVMESGVGQANSKMTLNVPTPDRK